MTIPSSPAQVPSLRRPGRREFAVTLVTEIRDIVRHTEVTYSRPDGRRVSAWRVVVTLAVGVLSPSLFPRAVDAWVRGAP